MNAVSFVDIPAELFPEQEILVFEDRRWTYAELQRVIRRAAAMLRELGVTPGDRVAVLQTNSDRYVVAYYAAAMIGATFIPLNYRAKPPELEHMIATARTRVLLVGDRYLEIVGTLRSRLPVATYVALESAPPDMESWEALLEKAPAEPGPVEVDDDEPSILMYTSGTTSLPKGVVLTHNQFTSYVVGNVEMADGTPRGASLLCAPLYHIAGMTNVMTSCFTGRKLVVLRQFDSGEWLRTVEREKITHAFVVPTMLRQLLADPKLESTDLSSLQNLSYGGAPMPFPVIRRAIEVFPPGVGFVNAFGQTETTSTLTVLGPEDHRLEGTPEEVETRLRRLRSIGRPLPDVEVRVVDDDGRPLERGQVGEIWVRTPRTMKGYASEEGETSSPAREGWLPTRDMGWIDEDGYVFLAGRKDDMIIRGGENIAPAEIEAVLFSHPAVEEAAVIGIPDEEWGQEVLAVVARRAGCEVSQEELVEHCRRHLASFKKPKRVVFVADLPKNPLGKILKTELRERYA